MNRPQRLAEGISAGFGCDGKIRPASVVHPNSTAIRTPAIAFSAGCLAVLGDHTDPTASRIDGAGVLSHVVGITGEGLGFLTSAVSVATVRTRKIPVTTDAKISAASVVHPDTLEIRAPTVAFGTDGVAVLLDEVHSATRIRSAGGSSLVVGVACNQGLGKRFLRKKQTNTKQTNAEINKSIPHDLSFSLLLVYGGSLGKRGPGRTMSDAPARSTQEAASPALFTLVQRETRAQSA
jgi:hypothetical protein